MPLIKEPSHLDLEDFICKPSQECTEEDCEKGSVVVASAVNNNPGMIMNILKNHPYIPTANLLEDLADKMRKKRPLNRIHRLNQVKELGMLFDQYADDLVEACSYNLNDLERCINALPNYFVEVMRCVIHNENYMKRILSSEDDAEQTLKKIEEKYFYYKYDFSICYDEHFKPTSLPTKRLKR